MMNEKEQDLHDELMDGSKQRFIENTMSSQPLVRKERVDFLARNYISFKRLSEKLNSIVKIIVSNPNFFKNLQLENLKNLSIPKLIRKVKEELHIVLGCQRCTLWAKDPTLNELYTYLDNNKEVRMSSIEDIVGYVLNNQQDLITADLQRYIQYYQSISKFSAEDKFFDGIQRKSAILLPVKDYDTGMPLGVLEIVNANSGVFDMDSQYMAYMVADFAGYVINQLNHEIRRRKAEHARTLLNQYAVKIFSQNKLSDLNKIACEAIRKMLSTNRVQFCFIEESLVDVNEYQIIVFSEILDHIDHQEDEDYDPQIREHTYTKFKTKEYFGIMGLVMERKVPTIVWNPKSDDRYNERIDLKSENPMYCFPIIDPNQVIDSKKVVGCVQFETMQLRILKGTQTLQQLQNPAHSSLLIDDHLKTLIKEFSSYIAQVLRIIRNQKLLKKFKNFILRTQESEVEQSEGKKRASQPIYDRSLTESMRSIGNEPQGQSDNFSPNHIQKSEIQIQEERTTKAKEIRIEEGFGDKIRILNLNKDNQNSSQLHIKVGNQSNKHSQAAQSQLGVKKTVGLALLKKMTRVNFIKDMEQEQPLQFDRKPLMSKYQQSPDKNDNYLDSVRTSVLKMNNENAKPSDDSVQFESRNVGGNFLTINKGSGFESESIQDTEEMISQRNTKQIAISKLTLKNNQKLQNDLQKYNEEIKQQQTK